MVQSPGKLKFRPADYSVPYTKLKSRTLYSAVTVLSMIFVSVFLELPVTMEYLSYIYVVDHHAQQPSLLCFPSDYQQMCDKSMYDISSPLIYFRISSYSLRQLAPCYVRRFILL